jgi:hypothetical protein
MSDRDLGAILTRAEQAYTAAKNDADDLGRSELTDATRQHFDHDVPALLCAIKELTAAQHWMVARDGGRFCEGCEWEIRRGEAYELLPGTGGLLQHVHCPDQKAVTSRGSL